MYLARDIMIIDIKNVTKTHIQQRIVIQVNAVW
jgi:hypothetical protein